MFGKLRKHFSEEERAVRKEKKINQDIHNCKGVITSNIGQIIESIMNEKTEI